MANIPAAADVATFKADIIARYKATMETEVGFPDPLPEWMTEDDYRDQWGIFGGVLGETLAYPILWWILNPPAIGP